MQTIANCLMHPSTSKQVEDFIKRPNGSVLLLGSTGSGKKNAAEMIAKKVLNTQDLVNYPYFLQVRKHESKQEISIDAIRDVINFLRLKVPGEDGIKRVILIGDAQLLSDEAQNSLLKVLEEPNEDSLFILSSPYKSSLMPTIVSRCYLIDILPVSLSQASDFYKTKYDNEIIQSYWQLSQGKAALLDSLLSDDSEHPLRIEIDRAKAFLRASRYERLITFDKLTKNRSDVPIFLNALSILLRVLHHGAVNNGRTSQIDRLNQNRKLINQLIIALEKNGNIKLAALELVNNLNV
jgi:hypothetical protein